MNMKTRTFVTHFILIFLLSAFMISCEKEENAELEFIEFSVSGQIGDSEISNENGSITSVISSEEDSGNLIAVFVVPKGVTVWVGDIQQVSGLTVNDFSSPLVYTLQAPDGIKEKDYTVTLTEVILWQEWGLGLNQTASKYNNRDYEWYCDQYGTGTYQFINCGPTSVAMAIRWADPTSKITPMDARNTYRPDGGWWYTTDIVSYLNDNGISNGYYNYDNSTTDLKSKIDAGNIAILCLDMYYIRSEENSKYRIDKFYNTSSTEWGHFIVIKGYREVDGTLFFEAYDPYSINNKYADGTFKGRNRYYRSSDLFTATQNWWKYMIVVQPKGKKFVMDGALDPMKVPVAFGGITE